MKKQRIEGLMIKASEVMHISPELFVTTTKELPDENIGIGGKIIDIVKRGYEG